MCIKTLAQISPGELSNAHAGLEGLSNCTKCHVLGNKVTNARCLDCHIEINQNIKAGTGFHSNSKVKGKECVFCHNEHHGRNFKLIKFDKSAFNHRETGFLLTGKHTELQCEECHKQKNIRNDKLKKRKNTYLGLEQTCNSCHEDYHQAMLGSECRTCHNTAVFKPALLFNHNNARFKLTGAHQYLNCSKCHKSEMINGKSLTKFKGISYQSCTSCHVDIHSGKFGTNCKKCHSTENFKTIITSRFNHGLTNFPLTGRHADAECSDCHKSGVQVKLKHEKCIECHEDFHKGEFTSVNGLRDCSECHNTDGFKPSLFSLDDHSKTGFLLTGSHMAVACKDCHFSDNGWKFNFVEVTCISCHKNIHENEISERFIQNNDCRNCHNDESWKSISFDHTQTGFLLEGKHKNLPCSSCHTSKEDSPAKYVFKSVGRECQSCHLDVHKGQFAINNNADCAGCHVPVSWSNLVFDHNKSKFPLTGAHKNLECSKCHKTVVAANNISYTAYKIGKSKCSDCH